MKFQTSFCFIRKFHKTTSIKYFCVWILEKFHFSCSKGLFEMTTSQVSRIFVTIVWRKKWKILSKVHWIGKVGGKRRKKGHKRKFSLWLSCYCKCKLLAEKIWQIIPFISLLKQKEVWREIGEYTNKVKFISTKIKFLFFCEFYFCLVGKSWWILSRSGGICVYDELERKMRKFCEVGVERLNAQKWFLMTNF